jgi:hypothetical protein
LKYCGQIDENGEGTFFDKEDFDGRGFSDEEDFGKC